MRFIPDLCCFTGVRLEVSIEIKPMRHVGRLVSFLCLDAQGAYP